MPPQSRTRSAMPAAKPLPHAVLSYRPDSRYNDRPDLHYDFPHGEATASYRHAIEAALGGLVVFYWTKQAGGRLAGRYFAVARPVEIVPHPSNPAWSRLLVADYVALQPPVPVGTRAEGYLGARHGDFVKAVRGLSEQDLREILRRAGMGAAPDVGPRALVESRRAARDRAFRERVLAAYGGRCALTGLALRADGANDPGSGWAGLEAEAAHIRPVAGRHGGSDEVRNGLPMLRTLHWLFDRGLLSAEPTGRLLISPRLSAQADARPVIGLLRREAGLPRLLLPADSGAAPDPSALAYHRTEIFQGA